jgi:hypothetical protein
MRTAALREGRDHDTSLPGAGAIALIVLLATLAAAQHAAAQSAPCTAIENDAERLACYDRALRGASPAPAAPAPTAPAAQATVAPAAQAPAAPAAQASAPAPAAGATAASAPADVVPIVIVSVRTLPGRETTFTTQDGRTWVQTDSQRIYGLPDTPFDAEIKPGAVGSKFLVPKGGGRAIRVRLVER